MHPPLSCHASPAGKICLVPYDLGTVSRREPSEDSEDEEESMSDADVAEGEAKGVGFA